MKTIIDTIEATDTVAMTKQQTKINQWRTTGLFVDMQVVATNNHITFVITRFKEVLTSLPSDDSDMGSAIKAASHEPF